MNEQVQGIFDKMQETYDSIEYAGGEIPRGTEKNMANLPNTVYVNMMKKQDVEDAKLETVAKTIPEAINEVKNNTYTKDEVVELISSARSVRISSTYPPEDPQPVTLYYCYQGEGQPYKVLMYDSTLEPIDMGTTEMDFSDYQLKQDGDLNTVVKTVVGAINEVNGLVKNKQSIKAPTLTTVSDEIVPAINEVNGIATTNKADIEEMDRDMQTMTVTLNHHSDSISSLGEEVEDNRINIAKNTVAITDNTEHIGDVTKLETEVKTDLVSAINEIKETPSGSNVEWNQIVTQGEKLAEITIEGTKTEVYAPQSGGDVAVDNKTIEFTYDKKLQIKNEGVTKSKINSEAGVVFEEDIQTLKNKVISAADNTLSNIETKHLKTGVLDTSSLTNDDVHIPSSKLVKTYADTKISIPSTRADRVMAWNSAGNANPLKLEKQYEHYMTIKRNATTDDTTYISFSVVNNESSITLAKLCSWLKNNGFISKSTAYPAGGLAAANTIYVASSSGGSPTTSFSATSCINGVYSTDGSTLKYIYRAGTEVSIDSGRWKLVKTIDRGYVLRD